MAKGIRELTPITDGAFNNPAGVQPSTVFEGVEGGDNPRGDASGIYARKVSAADIERFAARSGGEIDRLLVAGYEETDAGGNTARHPGKAYAYTDAQAAAEKARAEDAEAELDVALKKEAARALDAETALDFKKANRIAAPKPLSGIPNGTAPGKVIFRQSVLPVIATFGRIEFSDGSSLRANPPQDGGAGVFSYVSANNAETILYDGTWHAVKIDCGTATVVGTLNVEEAVWQNALYIAEDADLTDIHDMAVSAQKNAALALSDTRQEVKDREQAVEILAAENEERKNDINSLSASVERHDEIFERMGAVLPDGFDGTLPDDGNYQIQIREGRISLKFVGPLGGEEEEDGDEEAPDSGVSE